MKPLSFERIQLPECLVPDIRHRFPITKVGSTFDGAYYVPACLLYRTGGLLSLGIGGNADFEYDICVSNPNSRALLVDMHFSAFRFFLLRPLLHLITLQGTKLHLSIQQSARFWFLRFRKQHFHTLRRLVDSHTSLHELATTYLGKDVQHLMLKIDIEGGEYAIMDQLLEEHGYFDCLILELHQVEQHHDRVEHFMTSMKGAGFILLSTTVNESDAGYQIVELTLAREKVLRNYEQPAHIHLHIHPYVKEDASLIRWFNAAEQVSG